MPINFTAYIDDSHDPTQEHFVISVAVVGSQQQWNYFNKAWRRTLKADPSISHFHATEWRGLKGEFRKFREHGNITDRARESADAKRDILMNVIVDSGVKAMSVAINIADWKRVKQDHPYPTVIEQNPYKTALQEVIFRIAEDAEEGIHKITIVCDSDNRANVYQQVYENFRAKNSKTARKIGAELTFADDRERYGLQAADLLAHAVNQVHQEHGFNSLEAPPERLRGIFAGMRWWSYEYGMALLDAQTQE